MFLAFALLLSYVESLLPLMPGPPGMKLGLANLAAAVLLYLYGPREAFEVNVLRILLAGFLFGNLYSILYSLAGGLLGFAGMLLFRRAGGSVTGVSAAGGICHNLGQLLAAMLVTQTTAVIWYLPPLLLAGLVTGCAVGLTARLVLTRTAGYLRRERENQRL